jgi:uncharacterized protein DUF6916
MPASLTEQEFSRHLNTKFRVQLEDGPQIDLELVEVKGYLTKAGEQTGMERFSAFFKGPSEPYLAQRTYSLQHDRMGAFDVFLVPIARDEQGVRYEAVYNYFK